MKKFVTFILMIFSFFILTSCHGAYSTRVVDVIYPETFDETKNYKIVFWAKNDSRNDQLEVYQKAIADFQKIYTNIEIELKNYTDYGLIYNDVIVNIPTRTTPNVCIAYPDHVATYLEGTNVVADLDQLMSNSSYGLGGKDVKFDSVKKEEIVKKFLDEGLINGRQGVLPFVRSSEALYINKDYVEKLGFNIPNVPTWDWVWEVCQKAIDENNTNKVLYPLIYKSSDNMFISYKKQMNQAFTENSQVKFLNDETKTYLLDLYDKSNNKNLFSTFKQVSYPANFLNKWQCVMAVDSTAGATWMGYGASTHDAGSQAEGEPFETVVRVIPQVDDKNIKMISQGPSICVFGKEDKDEVVASWLFAQFLLTNDIQIGYSSTEGYVPVTNKAINSTEYKNYLNSTTENKVKLQASKLVIDNIDNTFITEVYTGSTYARNAASYLIEAVVMKNSPYNTSEKIDDLYVRTIRYNNLAQTEELNYFVVVLSVFLAAIGIIVIMLGAKLIKILRKKE